MSNNKDISMNHFESTNLREEDPEKSHEQSQDTDGHQETEHLNKNEHHTSSDPKEHDLESSHDESVRKPSPALEAFQAELANFPDGEGKLQHAISRMENALAQSGNPDFRTFWDIRKVCLDLFKENSTSPLRPLLWNKYTELSKEARRLKDILDEQSAFAAEQIEIAIQGIEKEIIEFEQALQQLPLPQFSIENSIFQEKQTFYQQIQRELNLLNAQAARINALRKELIKTEMRVRQKNKFFQRLSQAGDSVFPRRKNLIKEVSDHFLEDVNAFIEGHFKDEIHENSLFNLREDIKLLQGFAKVLTLNTYAFTTSRTRLSACWDEIKKLEKERKKERSVQREAFKQNTESVLAKIQELDQAFQEGMSLTDAQTGIDEITHYMRGVELGRHEIKTLRDELQIVRKKIHDKQKAEEDERLNRVKEKDRQKRDALNLLKGEIESLMKNYATKSIQEIEAERDVLLQKITDAAPSKLEKQELERLLKPLRDYIAELRENALLALSDNDKQAMQQLKEVLKQKQERRQEIKAQLEVLRKASNASGFDIEQSLNVNSRLNAEKERLEKINAGIAEIEAKIAELKKKI
ncbi:putative uncharacterized protein [Parachlamydia acanthamoebae UV-7]|jgi:hypothetical protein|uniref:Uncharacterized protein n=3 Tax=Parachlamydiaceae TaxID=92713 RepID=F8KZF4_PARAV|nr:hypothetical protein pah_c022o112 [Parachlamydia acanthamoebae str. Hall's coccus]KIA77952.1 hypothetical protein DB43_FG00110 [Parachlamydia acanthamoebae]CCB86294.1 putative uncharacterized protein [Parachlamydia acanthamoebae UV-7]